jgi:hypothetical protein
LLAPVSRKFASGGQKRKKIEKLSLGGSVHRYFPTSLGDTVSAHTAYMEAQDLFDNSLVFFLKFLFGVPWGPCQVFIFSLNFNKMKVLQKLELIKILSNN